MKRESGKFRRGRRKVLIVAALFAMIFAMIFVSVGFASAHTIYVPDDYTAIQEAVNAADGGDTIIVRDGIYRENIEVDKRLSIGSENGSDVTIVSAKDSNKYVFKITANYVNISGFTIKDAIGAPGILDEANYCNISGNKVMKNKYGIYLFTFPNDNLIYNNYFNNRINAHDESGENIWNITNKTKGTNIVGGHYLGGNYWSDYRGEDLNGNGIGDTLLPYNSSGGIKTGGDYLPLVLPRIHNLKTRESFFSIRDAIYDSDTRDGHTITVDPGTYKENVEVNKSLTIRSTSGNPGDTIVQANDSNKHVFTVTANNVNISGFTIEDAIGASGIYLKRVKHCNIYSNNAANNGEGIYLKDSSDNNLTNNTLNSNTDGICLYSSNDNRIYHNIFIDNGEQAYDDGSNHWYSTVTIGGGNFWSDHRTPDENGDGFVDTAYHIPGGDNTDNYPYTVQNGWSDSLLSVPIEYNTIHQAMDVADSGYTIHLSAKTYNENIDVNKSFLTITGEGADKTIVQAKNPDDYVFELNASYVNISGFTIKGGKAGVYLDEEEYCNISENIILNNSDNGIHLLSSSNNTIKGNNLSYNKCGFYLAKSCNNTITSNNVSSNNQGIKLHGSKNNLIYNNYFNNTNNAKDNKNNIWDITKTNGMNIIGGPYLGGNYWSDYRGEDLDGDGIGDTKLPYNCSGEIENGGDYLPLVNEFTSIKVEPLTATLNVTETEQFTATAYDQYGKEMPDVVFTWTSTNETVGTINETTGLFTAIAPGTATVMAYNASVGQSVNGTAEVTVIETRIPGDVNGDTEINIQDAVLLFNWVSFPSERGTTYILTKPENANVNGDTEINIQDAVLLFNWVSFPSERGTTYILQ